MSSACARTLASDGGSVPSSRCSRSGRRIDELEHEADVVAPVGRGEPRAAPVHETFDDVVDVVRPGAELGLDGGVFRVAQAVAVDDGLEQLGPSAEVVVEGRRVALAGELVDVAQRARRGPGAP